MRNNNVFYLANEWFFCTSTIITYRAAIMARNNWKINFRVIQSGV